MDNTPKPGQIQWTQSQNLENPMDIIQNWKNPVDNTPNWESSQN